MRDAASQGGKEKEVHMYYDFIAREHDTQKYVCKQRAGQNSRSVARTSTSTSINSYCKQLATCIFRVITLSNLKAKSIYM